MKLNIISIILEYLWCKHRWDIIKEISVFDTSYGAKPERPSYIQYVLRCKNCGDIKVRNT